ncbi:MAG: NADH-quinone oxidoreductase subunit L [Nitrososphaerota archaeon]|nr:NADH-quinone oxidoreductase subunit L [Nitrososphaerales archaeon]MDW8044361.1 NADH-quinone oxidoreductase subunit L [Nitrososphaerota archaeon]
MNISEVIAHLTWLAPYIGAALSLSLSALKFERARDYVAVTTLFLSALSSTIILQEVLSSREGFLHYSYPWILTLNITVGVYIDTLAAFMSLIVAWLCFLIGFYSLKYMEGDPGLTRYWFFFNFFTGSMLLLVLADNLILMFIGWEGTGLASYALIGHWYKDEEEKCVGDPGRVALGTSMLFTPSHSGVRALIFTRIGDVGFIIGIIILYMIVGTVSIPEIAKNAELWGRWLAARGLLLPFLLLFSLGALAKSAQFPFHEWLVTAMTGPTSVSALIHAATMVKAGVYFMLRFSPIFHLISHLDGVYTYFTMIAYIGAFTAFLMASQAIVARELKLVLAFSTASQLGYMFLAIGAAGLIHEFVEGFLASFNHLMSHAIFKASLFLAAGGIIHTVESRYLDDMGGLSKYMRITFTSTLIAALSLSGFPPLMGFWTKDTILEVVSKSGLIIPLILGILTAAITAFYSMKVVLRTFITPASHNVEHLMKEHKVHEAHPIMMVPYTILALTSLIVGSLWYFIVGSLNKAITKHILGLEEIHMKFAVHLDPVITTLSISMVIIGIGLSFVAYTGPSYAKLINESLATRPLLRGLHSFLYDRWYINPIYYRIIVNGFRWFSKSIFKWFDTFIIDNVYHVLIPRVTTITSAYTFRTVETAGIDRGYNSITVRIALTFSNIFRSIQTGRVNHYILIFLVGFALFLTLTFTWLI